MGQSSNRADNVIAIRVEANRQIGSGHAMRCMAISKALNDLGAQVVFLVSDSESSDFMLTRGWESILIDDVSNTFSADDAERLARYCRSMNIDCLLIDSYAVSSSFFTNLRKALTTDTRITYIDDLYLYSTGTLDEPRQFDVDTIINYSFFANDELYSNVYGDSDTNLMLGMRYAPLRDEFIDKKPHSPNEPVSDVMVTTGATNPDGLLERLVEDVLSVLPNGVRVHVVVGGMASYNGITDKVEIHRNVVCMSELMELCQVAVSAAGSTLYELCAMGVATLAVSMVDNQLKNMQAFVDCGFGLGCLSSDLDQIIQDKLHLLISDSIARAKYVKQCTTGVDSNGALRIANALMEKTQP